MNSMDRPCGDMGYYSNESPARGQLYLVTRDEEPFCAHQYQIKVYNSRSERSARSYGKLEVNGNFMQLAMNNSWKFISNVSVYLWFSYSNRILENKIYPYSRLSNVLLVQYVYNLKLYERNSVRFV